MPESTRHKTLCNGLLDIVRRHLGPAHTVASDAFVYFDASSANRKLAPDVFVKFGAPTHDFESWQTWVEGGVPELCIEILSPSDSPETITFETKIERYHALGTTELLVFHADGEPGQRLRAWDRVEGDLIERVVEDEKTPCLLLDAYAVVAPLAGHPAGLRIARDPAGVDLVRTTEEELELARTGQRVAEEERRVAEEERRATEEKLREAMARIASLESGRSKD
ncbi:MAG TPA: Uma2 family endonuclease [Labilithrix sp.]|nr:Uma2 family endonuclease [Labilithrix sp.]